MIDPINYVNGERLNAIRSNSKETTIEELLDVLELDIRKLTAKHGFGFDPNDVQNLLDIQRALKIKFKK